MAEALTQTEYLGTGPNYQALLNSQSNHPHIPDSLEEQYEDIMIDINTIEKGHFSGLEPSRTYNSLISLQEAPDLFEYIFILFLGAFDTYLNRILDNIKSGSAEEEDDPVTLEFAEELLRELDLETLPKVFEGQVWLTTQLLKRVSKSVKDFMSIELKYCKNRFELIMEILAEDKRLSFIELAAGPDVSCIMEEARESEAPEVAELIESIGFTASRIRSLLHSKFIAETDALEYIETTWGELACLEHEVADTAFLAVARFVYERKIPSWTEYGCIKNVLDPTNEVPWNYLDFGLYDDHLLNEVMKYCPHWMIAEA